MDFAGTYAPLVSQPVKWWPGGLAKGEGGTAPTAWSHAVVAVRYGAKTLRPRVMRNGYHDNHIRSYIRAYPEFFGFIRSKSNSG